MPGDGTHPRPSRHTVNRKVCAPGLFLDQPLGNQLVQLMVGRRQQLLGRTRPALLNGVQDVGDVPHEIQDIEPGLAQFLTRLAVNVTLRWSPTFRPLPASQRSVSPGKTTFAKSVFFTFTSVTWYGSR